MKTRTLPRGAGYPLGPARILTLGLFGWFLAGAGWCDLASAQGWKSPSRRTPVTERAVPPLDQFRPEKGGIYSNLGLVDRLTRDAVEQLADSLQLAAGTEVTVMSSVWHEANWFTGTLLAEALTRRGCIVTPGDWGTPPDSMQRPAGAQQPAQPPARPRPIVGGGNPAFEEPAEEDTTGAYADSVAIAEGREPSRPVETPAEPEQTEPPPEERLGQGAPEVSVVAQRPVYPPGKVLDLRVLEFGIAYPSVGRKLLFGPVRFSRVGGVFLQVQSVEGPEGTFHGMVSAERHRVDRLTGAQRNLVEGASYPFTPPVLTAPSLARYIEPTVVVGIVTSLVYLFYANQN